MIKPSMFKFFLVSIAMLRQTTAQNATKRYMMMYDFPDIPGFSSVVDYLTDIAVNEGSHFEFIRNFDIPGLTVDICMMAESLAKRAMSLPRISVEEDVRVYNRPPGAPEVGTPATEPLASSEETPYGIELVGALEVSDDAVGNVKVCIIDSGYSFGHPDLPLTATGADDTGAGPWDEDGSGHGTHVAGTIAAIKGNGQGVLGVNRNGEIGLHIVRVFDNDGLAFLSDLLGVLQDCQDAGATVVSMSFGRLGEASNIEETAYQSFYDAGMLLVAAAGNHGEEEGSLPSWPSSYPSVMAVAAIDQSKNVAPFSAFHDQVEISGPGVDVLSTVPGDSWEYFSGTSMACPHVSGVAALVWSQFPDLTNVELRNVLTASAEDLGVPGRDNDFGYGLVRADLAVEMLNGGTIPSPNPNPTPSPSPSPGTPPPSGECVNDPADWVDSDGDGCDSLYYGSALSCSIFGDSFPDPRYGLTANQVCCTCGGGSVSSGCEDGDWVDSQGDGCDWYEEEDDRCALFGNSFENEGQTAVDACCACQGVQTTSLFALSKDQPRMVATPDDTENGVDFDRSAGGPSKYAGALVVPMGILALVGYVL